MEGSLGREGCGVRGEKGTSIIFDVRGWGRLDNTWLRFYGWSTLKVKVGEVRCRGGRRLMFLELFAWNERWRLLNGGC